MNIVFRALLIFMMHIKQFIYITNGNKQKWKTNEKYRGKLSKWAPLERMTHITKMHAKVIQVSLTCI